MKNKKHIIKKSKIPKILVITNKILSRNFTKRFSAVLFGLIILYISLWETYELFNLKNQQKTWEKRKRVAESIIDYATELKSVTKTFRLYLNEYDDLLIEYNRTHNPVFIVHIKFTDSLITHRCAILLENRRVELEKTIQEYDRLIPRLYSKDIFKLNILEEEFSKIVKKLHFNNLLNPLDILTKNLSTSRIQPLINLEDILDTFITYYENEKYTYLYQGFNYNDSKSNKIKNIIFSIITLIFYFYTIIPYLFNTKDG
ncbi:MAG: hypothetical protein JXR46_11620 [Calditrichaceae bacterium]|nr:hypothetical protein [Calditrichaceae bacterium]MBN2709684.1 hypothetical protein [Calditrichaceae bacterium]RQV95042.1 MAG: hypothetical protein EH224_08660 [Calditrichota bacterium]